MKRMIEIKHVGPKEHVRTLIEGLLDRVEDRLQHFPDDSTSVHVLFEENGTKSLYRTSLTCHVPRHMVAAHEENRNAGTAIRKAFAELVRQLDRESQRLRHKHEIHKTSIRELQPEPLE